MLAFWDDRCKFEHGVSIEEQEIKRKEKLLNEIQHIQRTSHPQHNMDAKILHRDFSELNNLNCNQLQDWIVGARILYKTCRNKLKNIINFSTDKSRCQELEIDPG